MYINKIFKKRLIVFLMFILASVNGLLVFHEEKKTWSEAQSVCSLDGGTLVSTYSSKDILSLTPVIETIWEGRYYSPWAWLIGCYSYNGTLDYIELKNNQLKECLNHCNQTNYFGLQNRKCICFDTFDGEFKRTGDICVNECPGNKEERCGGPESLTIYMNDICYVNSSKWQGTVSRTFSGKQCLPWANVTAMQNNTLAVFPEGSADNVSNYCRDPTNKTYLWCYVSQDEVEQCDIPKCIAKDGVYPCMSFIKSGRIFYFTQDKCETTNMALCETSEHTFLWDRNIRTWTGARDQNRYTFYRDAGKSYYCYTLAGPGIFRLKTNLTDFRTWFAYSRNFCSVSTIVPSREPHQCVGMYNYNGIIRSRVVNCDERKAFICQYKQITCGEKFNVSLNGTLATPGYWGKGYDHYSRCVWTISVPDGYNVHLSINMSIEDTSTCRSDFIRIFSSNYGDGVSLCGDSANDLDIGGSNVTIEFRSDGTINGRGANITWVSVPVVTEATKPITSETSTLSMTVSGIVTDKDPNGDGNRFSMAGIPGETVIGIIVGILAAFGFTSGVLLVLHKRRTVIRTKESFASMTETRDRDDSTHKSPCQNPELYDNAMFGNETTITESSSNIYHNTSDVIKPQLMGHISNIYDNTPDGVKPPLEEHTSNIYDNTSDDIKPPLEGQTSNTYDVTCDGNKPELGENTSNIYDVTSVGNKPALGEHTSNIYNDTSDDIKPPVEEHTSNIYDNTSLERSSSFVVETEYYDFLGDSGQTSLKDDSNSIDSTSPSNPTRKSIISENTSSNPDVYNKLNEVNKHEYENQPDMVYINHTEADCVYDQTSTCRRESTANSIDLPESNTYDHFTNYNVEYSKASACGRQNVEDNMAMADRLTYDYLGKSQ